MTPTRKKILIGILGFFVLLIAWKLVSRLLNPEVRRITVVGTGRERVDARKATITALVTSTNGDRKAAITDGAQKETALIDALTSAGIRDVRKGAGRVGLVSATSAPNYQYTAGVELTINGREEIQSALRLLESQDAVVSKVVYFPDDDQQSSNIARQRAMENAQQKAEALAKNARGSIGKVLAVVEQQSSDVTGTGVTASAQSDEQEPSTFSAIDVEVTLTVSYELR